LRGHALSMPQRSVQRMPSPGVSSGHDAVTVATPAVRRDARDASDPQAGTCPIVPSSSNQCLLCSRANHLAVAFVRTEQCAVVNKPLFSWLLLRERRSASHGGVARLWRTAATARWSGRENAAAGAPAPRVLTGSGRLVVRPSATWLRRRWVGAEDLGSWGRGLELRREHGRPPATLRFAEERRLVGWACMPVHL
jgi:hypothetical protein